MNARPNLSMLIIALLASLAGADVFHEGWESASVGTYTPRCGDCPPTFVLGDEGDWYVGDTISDFPECGIPQKAEIVMYQGSKALKLTSTSTNSECADNVWVAIADFAGLYNPGFSVPLTPGMMLTFEETGELEDPQLHGWGRNCLFPPCFDDVSLLLTDNRGNVLAYVLQRYPGATANASASTYGHVYREIFLDPDARTYARDLYADFQTIPNFTPAGAEVASIEFKVHEHGCAIIDNITYGQSGLTLTVKADPCDGGTVEVSPKKAVYLPGESVTLTAIPAAGDGYVFTGWSGDLSGTTNPATIIMNSNKSVTANFEKVNVKIIDPRDPTINNSCMVLYNRPAIVCDPPADSPILSLSAQAAPPGGTFRWDLVRGRDNVRVIGNTDTNEIKIQATNPSDPIDPYDVEIVVEYTIDSLSVLPSPHFVKVQKPTSLRQLGRPEPENAGPAYLYKIVYTFQVMDQCVQPMPIEVAGMCVFEQWAEVCENYTTAFDDFFDMRLSTNQYRSFEDVLALLRLGSLFPPLLIPEDYVRRQAQRIVVAGWVVDQRCQSYYFTTAESTPGQCGTCPEAIIDIATKTVHPGQVQSRSLRIDPTVAQATFWITWPGSGLDLTLFRPDGREIGPDTVQEGGDVEFAQGPTYQRYTVQQPMPGEWTMLVVAVDVSPEGEECLIEVMAVSSLSFSLAVSETGHSTGKTIPIVGKLMNDGVGMVGATLVADVEHPDGAVDQLTLYDDGTHGDTTSNDGYYTGAYANPAVDGLYSITSAAMGTVHDEQFQRMAKVRFYVGDTPDVTVSGVTFSDREPLRGETTTVSAKVSNVGGGSAEDVSVFFYSGDSGNGEVFAQRVVTLAPGTSVTVAANWTVPAVCRTVYVVATPSDTFLEAKYDNNTASRDICTATMDLNEDGVVDFTDLSILCKQWLEQECSSREWCKGADLNFDDVLDLHDYAAFTAAWEGPEVVISVSPRPIAHWKFDEGGGTVAADCAGGSDGEVHGATWSEGIMGGALRFDGVDDYVDCGVHVPEVMSLSLWVCPESQSGTQTLACETDYSFYQNNLRLELRWGRVGYAFADGATEQVYIFGVTSPNSDEWTHLAVTRDGGEAAIYVNGAKDMSKPYEFVPAACSTGLMVGGTLSAANPFKGKIDDVRLYNRPLSEEETRELAQMGP